MKAKMPNKPPESAKYMCMQCNKEFIFGKGDLNCPSCGNKKQSELVPIDVRNNSAEESMYTSADWHGG